MKWIQQKKSLHEGDVNNYVLMKEYMDLQDYVNIEKKLHELAKEKEELTKQLEWIQSHSLDEE